ncbi:MAG TPA: hypothetical protein VKM54_14385 [Myxococcota bacterium]|nr:hypothetical protein [Myxococcota bacterium]
MGFKSWQAFYESDAQSLYAVVVLPVAFLGYLALRGRSAGPGLSPDHASFVRRYCIAFALLTIVDPLTTGPVVRALGGPGTRVDLVLSCFFVLLGDFRVFWLLFHLSGPRIAGAAALEAAGWTLIVPAAALSLRAALSAAFPNLPENTIWLVYEICFTMLALALRTKLLPARMARASPPLRSFVRAVAGYSALYYALWAISDTLILVFGLDAGWALRAVPNQLYYAWYVPLVWLGFFSPAFQGMRSSVMVRGPSLP